MSKVKESLGKDIWEEPNTKKRKRSESPPTESNKKNKKEE